MDQVYQVGNYLTTWCSHAEDVLDELGRQADLINDNLKLLYEEQQTEKREREERRRRKHKKKTKKIPKFHVDMSAPNYWDLEEDEEDRKGKLIPCTSALIISGFHKGLNKDGLARLLEPPVSTNASTEIHSPLTSTCTGIYIKLSVLTIFFNKVFCSSFVPSICGILVDGAIFFSYGQKKLN